MSGSKEFPLTPGPLQVPPDGDSPERRIFPKFPQTVSSGKLTLTSGAGFTLTVIVSVSEHPLASVPVTVYVSVVVGLNETLSRTPWLHAYEFAPPPVKVHASPSHNTPEVAAAVIAGAAFTLTMTVAVFVQPFAS